ncbi:MAG: sigma-70 family RNA polymerase sigma factor [Deltaproteobacteria bacterium]|nr:sigma-70 family RNA polymerase sigma factor [Deltaproteobacteria bacterium]
MAEKHIYYVKRATKSSFHAIKEQYERCLGLYLYTAVFTWVDAVTPPFRGYLLQICRNLMIDRARKYKREVLLEDLAPEGSEGMDIEAVIRSGDPPEETDPDLDAKRRHEAVREFLGTLDDDLRAIYQKRFEDGTSERDTAEELNITRRKVRTRHDHLVERLRDFLTEKACGLLMICSTRPVRVNVFLITDCEIFT